MSGTRLNVSLTQFDIGLSGAVPGRDSWSEPAMDRAILEFVALFSGIVFNWDFPFGFMPTNGVGGFRDFLPAPRLCKSFFQSAFSFCPARKVF